MNKRERKIRKFVERLEELTREYGLAIYGCGCCGSPWVDTVDKDELLPDSGYTIEFSGDAILACDLKWHAHKECNNKAPQAPSGISSPDKHQPICSDSIVLNRGRH